MGNVNSEPSKIEGIRLPGMLNFLEKLVSIFNNYMKQ